MTYIGVKKRLVNIPSSIPGVIHTILHRKQRNARKVPDLDTPDDGLHVYCIDGLGVGAGYTMVIRVDPNNR